MPSRPTVAVWKFTSCDGCQLALLDCEDDLLALAGRVRFAHFTEASRTRLPGPYDVSLVEGSVTTPGEVDRLRQVRERSTTLVAIGTCATTGGVQALRNVADVEQLRSLVYAMPQHIATLATSSPIAAHVPVDAELRGCPVDRRQLLGTISALLAGRRPDLPDVPVCTECKRRGLTCVLVTEGAPCTGPVTHAGCGAVCPAVGRACYGCSGPVSGANVPALAARLRRLGVPAGTVERIVATFATSPPAGAP
jgi:coenzyme F420-reducing hydrogenase gamma subunit